MKKCCESCGWWDNDSWECKNPDSMWYDEIMDPMDKCGLWEED